MDKKTHLIKVLQKLPVFIFLSGLFLLPHFYWLRAPVPYEVPKVFFLYLWTLTLGLSTAVSAILGKKAGQTDKTILYGLIVWLMVVVVSSFLGANIQKSLWGNYYRGDGLITLFALIALALISNLIWNKKLFKPLSLTLALSSFLLSSTAVINGIKVLIFHNYSVINWDGAISLRFGNPNFLAGYLAVTLPFIASLGEYRKTRKISFLAILLQVLAIGLTRSWFGIAVALLFFIGWATMKIKNKKHLTTVVSLITVLITVVGGFWFNHHLQLLKLYPNYMPEGRERIIRKALLALQQRPFLGWGWANFDYAFEAINWPMKWQYDIYVDKAHSNLLEVATTTGVIGLVMYLIITLKTFKNLFSQPTIKTRYLLLTLILYLIHSQTNIISVSEEVIFWIIVGISATC